MQKTFITVVFLVIALFTLYRVKDFIKNNTPVTTQPGNGNEVFCTADAMMCPDGSYVGRTGTKCEFVCPESTNIGTSTQSTASSTVILGLGDIYYIDNSSGPFTASSTFIVVKKIVEESRCPSDVTCIQAGRVLINVGLRGQEKLVEIGQSINSDKYIITLYNVTPYTLSTHKITDEEYRFSFRIVKNK